MVELSCPLCSSRVAVPRPEVHGRYFCRKCHTPFHLDKARVPVVGDPPSVDQELAELKQKIRGTATHYLTRKNVLSTVAVVLVFLLGYLFFGPAQDIKDPARAVAEALAAADVNGVKSYAVSGTSDDAARWYEIVQPQLVQARQGWHSTSEVIDIHVGKEDTKERQGLIGISIHPPALGSNRDVSIADATAAVAPAASPFDAETLWKLDGWGHWRFDGTATYAKIRPSP